MRKKNQNTCFVSCIVAAGGSGTRMGAEKNKLFLEINGVPIIARTLLALDNSEGISEIIISAREEDILEISALAESFKVGKLKKIVRGGAHRAASVKAALKEVSPECEYIAVHDGARPLISARVIENVVVAAQKTGAAACGVRPKCTLKRADEDGFIKETVDRSEIFEIQTPQVFLKEVLTQAYDAEDAVLEKATYDCSLVERLGKRIFVTEGDYRNIKATTPEDILVAEALLEEEYGY